MKYKSDEISEFIAAMQDEIIAASDAYVNIADKYNKKFKILDYTKILNLITQYMRQYVTYLHTEKDKYKDRILGLTQAFYDSLFKKEEYKKEVSIQEFKDEIDAFINGTKGFQTVIKEVEHECCCDCAMAKECEHMVTISVNEYLKIGRVFRTDLNLYNSIRKSGSKVYNEPFTSEQSYVFSNEETPCMHIVKG